MYRLSDYGSKSMFNIKLIKNYQKSKHFRNFLQENSYSSNIDYKTAKTIRKEFIEYFTNDLNHTFIPSSSVIPWCDPSVSFINSGMNQFKGIFLGDHDPPALKAANYQKCIRVGGKHNDLTDVGLDSYHHTFFEMLGNWSFGAYGKEEACKYAWDMLTKLFGINEQHLYVTYFGGDDSVDMKADNECRDIWLKIGVPSNRIFSSGMKDNFWEMDLNGPCGPCTEIHIDKTLYFADKDSNFQINTTNLRNLTELWNIVFIECQRLQNNSIIPLNKQYIDTGMGFERIVAVLQGKSSNYDTDLFQPLFEAIHKMSDAPRYRGKFGAHDEKNIDTGYRILADHARMVTVALADGMVPEKNHKLRRILRKAIMIGSETFKTERLLNMLTNYVAESLGDTYSEIVNNLKQIQTIIDYETDLLSSLRASSEKQWQNLLQSKPSLATISDPFAPGLIRAYEELQSTINTNSHMTAIPGNLLFKMYDTYGLDIDLMEEIAEVEGLNIDRKGFNECMKNAKLRSRINTHRRIDVTSECLDLLEKNSVPMTDDSYKYIYNVDNDKYQFKPLECKVVALTMNGNLITESSIKLNEKIRKSSEIGIILDKTLFYAPEGGQRSDKGSISTKNELFHITEVHKQNGYVIHQINFNKSTSSNTEHFNVELSVGDEATIIVDGEYRINMMKNHTATHLLNAALRNVFPAVAQKKSIVTNKELIFKFNTFGIKILPEHIRQVEKLVNDCINAQIPVQTKSVDMFQLLSEKDLILVPGEVYPDKGLRIIVINGAELKSKEACCGTHVHNTSVLNKFAITDFITKGTANQTIKAATGKHAQSKLSGRNTSEKNDLNTSLNYLADAKTEDEKKQIIQCFVTSHMVNIVSARTDPFIVHCLDSNDIPAESVPLQKAFEFCIDLPVFLIVKSRRKVKARCVVPEEYQSDTFNAQLWMESISKVLPIKLGSFDDENPLFISHTKILKLSRNEITPLTENALREAKLFVSKHVKDVKQVNHVSN